MAYRNLLQNVYLFKTMTSEQLDKLNDIVSLETFSSGDEIFSQGDTALALYIVKFGFVRIVQKGLSGNNVEITSLGSGSHFGEMALVDGEPRSATAVAIEKSDILSIPYDKLKSILEADNPMATIFYKELAHFLCGRLRVTTSDMSFAREKNIKHF